MVVTYEQMQSLQTLAADASGHRSALVAMDEGNLLASIHESMIMVIAAKCCEVLGLDPDDGSYQTETIRSIAEAGIDLIDAVSKVQLHVANQAFAEAGVSEDAH